MNPQKPSVWLYDLLGSSMDKDNYKIIIVVRATHVEWYYHPISSSDHSNLWYGVVWYGNPNCTIREATAAARHILFGALCIICALRRLDKYIHIHLVHNIYGRMCVSVFLFFVVFSIPTQSLLWFRGVSIEIYIKHTHKHICVHLGLAATSSTSFC